MSMGAFLGDNENVTELERCDECTNCEYIKYHFEIVNVMLQEFNLN